MNTDEKRPLVLLADDDEMFVADLAGMLKERFRINAVHSGEQVLYSVVNDPPEVVLLDIEFDEKRMDGFAVLEALKSLEEPPPVIMVSGRRDMSYIVRAVKLGAFHYIRKDPYPDPDDLLHVIELCLEENRKRRRLRLFEREAKSRDSEFVAVDRKTVAIVDEIERIAGTPASVLITGPTGAGKEMVAKEIHRRSKRRAAPLVTIDCTTLPKNLIESELFGSVPGAFNGAVNREGLIASARGGTVFLDEIGEAPASLQQKLLRVIEERRFRSVGSDVEKTADVRIIAATRRDIEAEMGHGRFREDLYFRLNVLRIHVPPLTERPADIMPLAETMREQANRAIGRSVIGFTEDAAGWLTSQAWPGNARELRNVVDRAVIHCTGDYCGLGHVVGGWPGQSAVPEPYHVAKEKAVQAFQLAYVVTQLERHEGVIAEAARESGISRQAFSRLCGELGVDMERYRRKGTAGEKKASSN